jgi:hypothetical protein
MANDNGYSKRRLSEQLPSHSPDPEMWQRIAVRLDQSDADAALHEKLSELPVHTPDSGTWSLIAARLNRAAFYRTALRTSLAAAAVFLLFLTVSRVMFDPSAPVVNQKGTTAQLPAPEARPATSALSSTETSSSETSAKNVTVKARPAGTPLADNAFAAIPETESAAIRQADNGNSAMLTEEVKQPESFRTAETDQPPAESSPENPETGIQPTLIPVHPELQPETPDLTYYYPGDPKPAAAKNHFAVAMDYLPENINNGTDNSLFHNFGVTASYNKEKIRFNTSLGMAYNQEQVEFGMNYDVKTPVTAPGPGGTMDTIGFNISKVESEYQGTEKHQYLTYNLGFGRRLFAAGRFSSWLSAGAGFGVRMNNPDLISSTEKQIKGNLNAQITGINSTRPVYNNVNVNFVTGIDFNYRIADRFILSFCPTSRWYFKPVLMMNNEATDELTLGFRTGMKFEF